MAEQRGAAYRVVHSGDKLDWDPALTIEVLSLPATFINPNADSEKVSDHGLHNSNSIALRVQHGKTSSSSPATVMAAPTSYTCRRQSIPQSSRPPCSPCRTTASNPGIQFPKLTHPQIVVASCLADYPGNASTTNPRFPPANAPPRYSANSARRSMAPRGMVTCRWFPKVRRRKRRRSASPRSCLRRCHERHRRPHFYAVLSLKAAFERKLPLAAVAHRHFPRLPRRRGSWQRHPDHALSYRSRYRT